MVFRGFGQGQSIPSGLLSDSDIIDNCFEDLRAAIYRQIDRRNAQSGRLVMFREHGYLSAKCRYFYVQTPGDIGQLFERSGRGWVHSFAERIRDQELFIRRGEAADQVILQYPEKVHASPQVISQLFGPDPMSVRIYIRKTLQYLFTEE